MTVRPTAQTLQEEEGSFKTARRGGGVENVIVSWREIARCSWVTGVFLGGKSRGAFGLPAFFLAGNRTTIVAFEKEVSLKAYASLAKRLYESTEVLDKKKSYIYKWKEKVQKNTGRRRKVQVTKAAFKGLHRFVFFTAESLPCSET